MSNQQCEKATYRKGKKCVNHISKKGLVSKIHEKLLQLNGGS